MYDMFYVHFFVCNRVPFARPMHLKVFHLINFHCLIENNNENNNKIENNRKIIT